jgi:hypothetical protein
MAMIRLAPGYLPAGEVKVLSQGFIEIRRKHPIGFAPWPPARYGEVIWDNETFHQQLDRLSALVDLDDDDDDDDEQELPLGEPDDDGSM